MGGRSVAGVAERFGGVLLELGGNNAAIVTVGRPRSGGPGDRVLGSRNRRPSAARHWRLIVPYVGGGRPRRPDSRGYRQLPVGDPAAGGTLVGPLIHGTAYQDMVSAPRSGRADGGEVIGGDRQEIGGPAGGNAYYVAPPAVVRMPSQTDVSSTTRVSPHSPRVMTYETFEEAVALNNAGTAGRLRLRCSPTYVRPSDSSPPTVRTAVSPTST